MKLEDITSTLRADVQAYVGPLQQAQGVTRQLAITYDQSASAIASASARMDASVVGAYGRINAAAAGTIASFHNVAAASAMAANTVAGNMARLGGAGGGRVPPYQTGFSTNFPPPPFGFTGGGGLRRNVPLTGDTNALFRGGVSPSDPATFSRQFGNMLNFHGVGGGGRGGPPPPTPAAGGNEGWRWNWGAAAGGGMAGRILGGPTAGMMGALGGGIGGVGGALAGAGAGIGLEWLVVKPLSLGVELAVGGLKMIAEAGTHLVSKIIELGASFERTQAVFGVIAGSPAAGNELLTQIRSMALQSPYTSRQLYPQGQMLLGMGVGAGETPSVLSRLGDIAGGDPQRLHRLALAYGQARAAGRLVGYELRQFTEAGVGVGDFAKAAGMSVRDFRDAMQAPGGSQIGPEVIDRTLNQLTGPGGRFQGLSSTINRQASGQYNALIERLEMTGETFGKTLLGRFDVAGRLERLSESFDRLAESSNKALPAVDEIVKMGDALFEASMALVKEVGPGSWEELTATLSKFGKEDLPAVVQGVMELSGAFMKLLALSLRIVEVSSNAVFSPVDMWMNMNPLARLFPESREEWNKTRGAGINAIDRLATSSGQAGDWIMNRAAGTGQAVGTAYAGMAWQDESAFATNDTNRELIAAGLLRSDFPMAGGNRNALNADAKRRALQAVGAQNNPFLNVFARAFGVTGRPGYQSPALLESSRREAMGLLPGDMEYASGFRERQGNAPFSQYQEDVGRIRRLSRSPFAGTPFGGFSGMGPELSGRQAATALEEAADKLKKALEIPVDPLKDFGKRMRDIERATQPQGAFAAVARAAGMPGAISEMEANLGAFANFQNLRQMVEQQMTAPALPTTRTAGSVEAMDLLNQSANEQKVVLLDIKGVLDAIEKIQAEHAKDGALIRQAMEKLNREKIVVKAGEDK